MSDEEILKWLCNCPAHDANFKAALDAASATTLEVALAQIDGIPGKKTASRAIASRRRSFVKCIRCGSTFSYPTNGIRMRTTYYGGRVATSYLCNPTCMNAHIKGGAA